MPESFLSSEPLPERESRPEGEPLYTVVGSEFSGLDFDFANSPESEATILIADFDGDHRPDLFLADEAGDASVFLQRGEPLRFKAHPERVAFGEGSALVDADAADMDGDGDLDLVFCRKEDHPMIWVNDGSGGFEDRTEGSGLEGASGTWAAVVTDNDRDGDLDLLLTEGTSQWLWDNESSHLGLRFAKAEKPEDVLGNGDDGLLWMPRSQGISRSGFVWPAGRGGVAFGDIDGDGLDDVICAGNSPTEHYGRMAHADDSPLEPNRLLLAISENAFANAAWLAGVARTGDVGTVVCADFDLDGRPDLFFANGTVTKPERHLAFRNAGGLRFEECGAAWGLDNEAPGAAAEAADLDGDGDLDLLVAHSGQPLSILRNGEPRSWRISIRLIGDDGVTAGTRVEVETRSRTQIRRAEAEGEDLVFGFGEDDTALRLSVRWPDGREQQFVNLAAGHRYTVRAGSRSASTPGSTNELITPKPRFEPPLPLPLAAPADLENKPWVTDSQAGFAVFDFDNDADLDVFAAGSEFALWRNDGSGRFVGVDSPALSADKGKGSVSAEFFDADGDADLDLFVVTGVDDIEPGDAALLDRLYLNDGEGNFSESDADALPDLRDAGTCVRPSDIDGDGDLDLFIGGGASPGRYPHPGYSRLLINETREGGPVRYSEAGVDAAPGLRDVGLVTDAVWGDCDGDGDRDLLLTTEWGTPRLFENEGEGRLAENTEGAGLAGLTGLWDVVAGADIDGDGDLDFALGNHGLNSPKRASGNEPALLFYRAGEPAVTISAYFEGGRIYPSARRSEIVATMPSLAAKFPTTHDYAGATLDELVGREWLQAAVRLEAATLASGVLINDGAGRFSFRPFPHAAQLSAISGLFFADLNRDGSPDIVTAGGHGMVLLGDGEGGFEREPASDSGMLMSAFADVVFSDIDGDGIPDLVCPPSVGVVFWQRGLR